jgi:hypothetical protein
MPHLTVDFPVEILLLFVFEVRVSDRVGQVECFVGPHGEVAGDQSQYCSGFNHLSSYYYHGDTLKRIDWESMNSKGIYNMK